MGLTASDIVFSEATPEQRQLAWELSAEAWAAPMALGDYVERERYLAEQELTRGGRSRHWVLYLKGYPRQVIASCETTRKPVLISSAGGGPVREGYGCTVANVYTNPIYRRQGMAAFLLRRVQEQMDADSDFSVLYSDSGRNYYAGLGWSPFASRQATLTLLPPPGSSPRSHQQNRFTPIDFTPSQPSRTRPLRMSELHDLCELDELRLAARFNALPADGKTRVAFLPTHAQVAWQLARSEFDAHKLLPPGASDSHSHSLSSPSGNGAGPLLCQGAITVDGRAWASWAHDWRDNRLRVLQLASGLAGSGGTTQQQRVADVAALLEAAVAEAARYGLGRVVIWNPDEEVRLGCKAVGNRHPEALEVVFEDRVEGGIPSFRWRGGRDTSTTVWEENFGYCWC